MSPDYLTDQKEEVDVLEAIYQDDYKDMTKPSAWNVCYQFKCLFVIIANFLFYFFQLIVFSKNQARVLK